MLFYDGDEADRMFEAAGYGVRTSHPASEPAKPARDHDGRAGLRGVAARRSKHLPPPLSRLDDGLQRRDGSPVDRNVDGDRSARFEGWIVRPRDPERRRPADPPVAVGRGVERARRTGVEPCRRKNGTGGCRASDSPSMRTRISNSAASSASPPRCVTVIRSSVADSDRKVVGAGSAGVSIAAVTTPPASTTVMASSRTLATGASARSDRSADGPLGRRSASVSMGTWRLPRDPEKRQGAATGATTRPYSSSTGRGVAMGWRLSTKTARGSSTTVTR